MCIRDRLGSVPVFASSMGPTTRKYISIFHPAHERARTAMKDNDLPEAIAVYLHLKFLEKAYTEKSFFNKKRLFDVSKNTGIQAATSVTVSTTTALGSAAGVLVFGMPLFLSIPIIVTGQVASGFALRSAADSAVLEGVALIKKLKDFLKEKNSYIFLHIDALESEIDLKTIKELIKKMS